MKPLKCEYVADILTARIDSKRFIIDIKNYDVLISIISTSSAIFDNWTVKIIQEVASECGYALIIFSYDDKPAIRLVPISN